MIKLYEVENSDGSFYWDVYSSQDECPPEWDEYLRTIEENKLEEYLDKLRSDMLDFTLYTIDWYEQHLALGRS